jgi:hypothetical protein
MVKISDELKKYIEQAASLRDGYLEAMAAAYLLHTGLTPDQVVLVEQRDGDVTRWHFEKKNDTGQPPVFLEER